MSELSYAGTQTRVDTCLRFQKPTILETSSLARSYPDPTTKHLLELIMAWYRVALGVAILALTAVMLVPLPLWLAVTLMSISLVSAATTAIHRAFTVAQ